MQTKWNLDPAHSEITFKVKHMMITNVSGTFEKFDVQVSTDGDDFSTAHIDFTAETASINSGNEPRDGHLKSPDFFDVENHPVIKFVSTTMDKKDESNFVLHGNMTIKNITKPATFNVEFGGIAKDPWGNEKAGFTLSGKINRNDWDLNWNAILDTGGMLVSEEVKLAAEIQMTRHV